MNIDLVKEAIRTKYRDYSFRHVPQNIREMATRRGKPLDANRYYFILKGGEPYFNEAVAFSIWLNISIENLSNYQNESTNSGILSEDAAR